MSYSGSLLYKNLSVVSGLYYENITDYINLLGQANNGGSAFENGSDLSNVKFVQGRKKNETYDIPESEPI